jgi:hypothetical protein
VTELGCASPADRARTGTPGIGKNGIRNGIRNFTENEISKTGFGTTGFGTGFGKTGGPALPDLHMGLWPKNRISTRFFFVSCFRVSEHSAVLGSRRNANGAETKKRNREEIETGENLLRVVF